MKFPQTCPKGQTKEIQDGGAGNEELWSVTARCDSRSPSPILSTVFPQSRTGEDDADPPSNVSGTEYVGSHLENVAVPGVWQTMLTDLDNRKSPEVNTLER